jgi:hypothetical protein
LAETGRLHGLERLDPRRRVIHVTGLDAIIDGKRNQRLGRCALKNMAAFTVGFSTVPGFLASTRGRSGAVAPRQLWRRSGSRVLR